MLFNVQERIGLLNFLPREGNAAMLRILRDFQNEASFTEDEKAEMHFVHNEVPGRPGEGQYSWDATKAKDKEIETGDTMEELIAETLKKLDAAKKLPMSLLSLYERVVPSE